MVKEQVRVTVSPAIIFEEGEDFRNRVTIVISAKVEGLLGSVLEVATM
jgi:hypothetical protein